MELSHRMGRGEWDAEPSAACGRCSEAEHPQRSKNRASEQREDFFGHRKADGVGADFAQPQAETRQTGNAAGDR